MESSTTLSMSFAEIDTNKCQVVSAAAAVTTTTTTQMSYSRSNKTIFLSQNPSSMHQRWRWSEAIAEAAATVSSTRCTNEEHQQ